jgi:hypothetical protein
MVFRYSQRIVEWGIGERSISEYVNFYLVNQNLKELDESWQNWVEENIALGVKRTLTILY